MMMMMMLLLGTELAFAHGPAGSESPTAPGCMRDCVVRGRGCRACMAAVQSSMFCVRRSHTLPYHRWAALSICTLSTSY